MELRILATIVTVHGTNASGPADAVEPSQSRWWQRNSYFIQHIRELVEAEDGELSIKPFLWDGKNSEASRYQAGEQLHALLKTLESEGKSYSIVGHSHGGSVIAHAAMISGITNHAMSGWKTWITVGTPFIHLKKNFLLFSRLGTPARAAYMLLVLYVIAATLFPFFIFQPEKLAIGPDLGAVDQAIVRVGLVMLLMVPGLIGFFLVSYLQPEKLKHYSNRQKTTVQQNHQARWLGLWHARDEALQGLKRLHQIRIRPFGDRFATSAILFLAIFILPATFFLVSLSPEAVDWLIRQTASNNDSWNATAREGTFVERFVFVVLITISAPMRLAMPLIQQVLGIDLNHIFVLIVGLVVGILITWAAALMIYIPFKYLSELISRFISSVLNGETQKQINKSALGSDTVGESALYANEYPFWMRTTQSSLPEELSDEISAVSDAAVAESASKIRDVLNTITFSEKHEDAADLMSDYLTWKELIHTTYFHVPRFRKLIAYAISQADGFSTSDKFRADPDFELVKAWYEEISVPISISDDG